MIYYKKIGKRYIPIEHYDTEGLPEGLYLFFNPDRNNKCSSMMNMGFYTKVHQIQNVGRFCDLVVQINKEELSHKIVQEVESFRKNNNDRIAIQDMINCMLKVISDEFKQI